MESLNSYALVAYVGGPVARFVDKLRAELSPGCPHHAHITVLPPRPLGCPPAEAADFARHLVAQFDPFDVRPGEMLEFRNTQVIYISLASGIVELNAMHDVLNTGVLEQAEAHPYVPHITVGRELAPVSFDHSLVLSRRRWERSCRIRSRPRAYGGLVMFTWVCPNCGKELDVAVKECPDCRDRAASMRQASPEVVAETPPSGIRFWILLGIGALAGVALLAFLVHYRMTHASPAPEPSGKAGARLTTPSLPPPEAVPEAGRSSARDVEVAGVRMSYDAHQKPQVKALIINHGEDPLERATLTVTLRQASSAPGSPPLAHFDAKIASPLKPGDAREITAPLDALATLAAMPAWRDLRADVDLH